MKFEIERHERKPSGGAIEIACDEWLVGEPFRVTIREEPAIRLYPIPPGFVILEHGADGFQVISLKQVVEGQLTTNGREEALC